MGKESLNDLAAFVAVAQAKSFTRAAAQIGGVSESALSMTIRELEARLGVALLSRTTRSVAPTEAGVRLLLTVAPRLDEIQAALTELVSRKACRSTRRPFGASRFRWRVAPAKAIGMMG